MIILRNKLYSENEDVKKIWEDVEWLDKHDYLLITSGLEKWAKDLSDYANDIVSGKYSMDYTEAKELLRKIGEVMKKLHIRLHLEKAQTEDDKELMNIVNETENQIDEQTLENIKNLKGGQKEFAYKDYLGKGFNLSQWKSNKIKSNLPGANAKNGLVTPFQGKTGKLKTATTPAPGTQLTIPFPATYTPLKTPGSK